MYIRPTKPTELERVTAAYDTCRAFMRAQGNDRQWVDGYPSQALLAADIAAGKSYVCCEGEKLLAVFSFVAQEQDDAAVTGGDWPAGAYGALYRIGVLEPGREIAGFCFDWCTARCGQLRAYTHALNAPMQRALGKSGFVPCGTVCLADGAPRAAFCRPAVLWFGHEEARRRMLLGLCAGFYALATALALWLLRDLWLPLSLLLALLLLSGSLTLSARLGRGGGITLTPEGFEHRLADRPLHGFYNWSDFDRADFSRDRRTILLHPRDPDAFLSALPKRARKALRQKRINAEAFPLPCLLLSKANAARVLRLMQAYIAYRQAPTK